MTRLRICLVIALLGAVMLGIATLTSQAETLQEAWATALAADHRVQASLNETVAAQQRLSAAKAARWPSVTVEGGYIVLSQRPETTVSLPGLPTGATVPVTDDDNFFSARGFAVLPLFTSGRIRRGIDAASAAWQATQADEDSVKLNLKLQVAEAYVAVLRAQRGVAVVQRTVTSLGAHATDVSNLFKKALVARNDQLAAQVALADARQLAIQADNSLDIARAAYNRLLGRPLTQSVTLEELTIEPTPGDVEPLTTQALQQRSELTGLQKQVSALRHQAASGRAAVLPQVAIGGGYSYVENSVFDNDIIGAVGIGVRWNLFDGGIARHRARALDYQAEAVVDRRSDLKSLIALQVRESWLDVGETRKRLKVTREAITQAEENLTVAKNRYRSGVGTNTEVLDAETLRTRSLSNHNNAIYDAGLANLRLRRAVGDL